MNNWNKFFNIIYSLAIIAVILVLCLTAYTLIYPQSNPSFTAGNPDVITQGNTFALILAGITIVLGSSIIIPRVSLKGTVQEEINEKFTSIKKELEKEYEAKTQSHLLNETRRVDAHLSRMIAVLLKPDDPIWSIGWSLRSARRYLYLDDKRLGFSAYQDLVNVLYLNVEACMKQLPSFNKEGIEVTDEEQIRTVISNLTEDLYNHIQGPLTGSQKQTLESFNTDTIKINAFTESLMHENIRKVIRLLKDYFDLELEFKGAVKQYVLSDKINNPNSSLHENSNLVVPIYFQPLYNLMRTISPFILIFILTIKDHQKVKKHFDDLVMEISKISYSQIWSGMGANQYQRQLRNLINSLDDIEVLKNIVAQLEHSEPNKLPFSFALDYKVKNPKTISFLE